MPFDSEPAAEVTARDRVMRLRDFLEALPEERFDIRSPISLVSQPGSFHPDMRRRPAREILNECGTAACICGWADFLFWPEEPSVSSIRTGRRLGLNREQQSELFMPHGYTRGSERYTRARAVAVLDHYLATGAIDWEVGL